MWWLALVSLALAGGAVGSLLVWRTVLDATFDWGNFLGLLLTTSVAAAVAATGLREYHRRQVRHEVSRRWIDETLTKAGVAAGEDYERELTNWTICHQLIEAADAGVSDSSLGLLAAQIDPRAPVLAYEHRRLIELFGHPGFVKAMGSFYGHLRASHIAFAVVIPGLLASLPQVPVEARQSFLAEVRANFEKARKMLDVVQPFTIWYARVAREFESLAIKNHDELQKSGERLASTLDALAEAMKDAIEHADKAGLAPEKP